MDTGMHAWPTIRRADAIWTRKNCFRAAKFQAQLKEAPVFFGGRKSSGILLDRR